MADNEISLRSYSWDWKIRDYRTAPESMMCPGHVRIFGILWYIFLHSDPHVSIIIIPEERRARLDVSFVITVKYAGEILYQESREIGMWGIRPGTCQGIARFRVNIDKEELMERLNRRESDKALYIRCILIQEIEGNNHARLPGQGPFMYGEAEDVAIADYVLKVEKSTFPVPKERLRERSAFFRNRFKRRKNERQYTVQGVTADVVNDFVKFMQRGVLGDLRSRRTLKLYKLADMFRVDSLKDACSKRITKNMTQAIVFDVILLSQDNKCPMRKSAARFIGKHAKAIFFSTQWQKLQKDNGFSAMQILKMALKEYKFSLEFNM